MARATEGHGPSASAREPAEDARPPARPGNGADAAHGAADPARFVEPDGRPSGRGQKFLEALKDYKEFLLILVFFLGGVSWIYGYFATKEQVRVLRCLLNTNVEFVSYQIQSKLLLDQMHQIDAERIRLTALDRPSLEDKLNLHQRDVDYELSKANLARADQRTQDALHRLQTNQCEEVGQAPEAPKAKE